MPGRESLRKQEYYGHPRNQFWNIMYSMYGQQPELEYARRVAFLKKNGIALWDVIQTCSREGSMDSNIANEKVNDFEWLFFEYPDIGYVFFNGAKAYETFRKKIGFKYNRITFTRLGSTSPANVVKFEERLKQWKIIKECLERQQ